jgi:hypothetical protein
VGSHFVQTIPDNIKHEDNMQIALQGAAATIKAALLA